VDEAGRTTQSPLIMAPPSLKADPDGEAADTIIDNGIMSSSRKRTGSSRSEVPQWAGEADVDSSSSGDAATAAPAAPADEDATEAGSSTEDSAAAASATAAANGTSAARSDRVPSFRASAAATSTSAAPASASSSAEPDSAYPGSGSPYQDSSYRAAYASRSSYSRSDWSTSADPASPASAPAAPAPAGGAGNAPPSITGYSSRNGVSSGAASAVTGAAAGLASSVSSAWQKQKRGAARNIQTRKSNKRQAMLTLARVEPWSVMKFSFVASVVAFIILFVAVAVLYMVLSALGVFDSLQHTVSSITSSQSDSGTNISHWFSASLILGYTAMLGALNIVLITAMSTVGSVIYNLIAKTIGGIEVTLRETD
jgi:hypothetical protein